MEIREITLLLLMVGLLTAFVVLLIMIYLGRFLIYLVGKYAPEELASIRNTAIGPMPTPRHVVVVITAAVNVVTHNKGKVVKIEKDS